MTRLSLLLLSLPEVLCFRLTAVTAASCCCIPKAFSAAAVVACAVGCGEGCLVEVVEDKPEGVMLEE